jgi:hypothetical protein
VCGPLSGPALAQQDNEEDTTMTTSTEPLPTFPNQVLGGGGGLNIVPHLLQYGTTGSDPENPTDWLVQMGPVDGGPPVRLLPGCALYSPGRTFRLILQASDGNLVLQNADTSSLPGGWPSRPLSPDEVRWDPIWSWRTDNQSVTRVDMQADGNFVAYNGQGHAVKATNTAGNFLAFARMQDDGNFIITAADGTVVFQTQTSAQQAPGRNV